MGTSRTLRCATLVLTLLQLCLTTQSSNHSISGDLRTLEKEINILTPFKDHDDKVSSTISRNRRNSEIIGNEIPLSTEEKIPIEDPKCRQQLRRLCGDPDNSEDQLFVVDCVKTFKPAQTDRINNDCQHAIWRHIMDVTSNDNIRKLSTEACGNELDNLHCFGNSDEPGAYLACLITKRETIKEARCSAFIKQLRWVAVSGFGIVTPMMDDCQADIEKLKCGRIERERESLQGQMLNCLQSHIRELEPQCKRGIYRMSEIQGDNVKLDPQLYLACAQDQMKFCENIRPGSGQVYKCLLQHKLDRAMTKQCRDQLSKREGLIASDYRVSKGLVKACRDDIKNNHCRKSVSDDKEIRLAQILLCLETVAKNGTKIDPDCQEEMFDHRKILMRDYRLSPEIVNGCANDISNFCKGLAAGGATIHCLMEHSRTRKKKSRVSTECQRAIEDLIEETDAGEDWRIDPVLREKCRPVVDIACRDVPGGDARVIYCLIDKLGTDKMTKDCETAILQIQYFVVRDYKLDPQLYRACKFDAVKYCHGNNAWHSDGTRMDPEVGPLVLPCLYRYATQPRKNLTLRVECLDEIRRIMRQRAISVDLQPEVEDVCLNELATFCYDKPQKGEEILCLQDNLERLSFDCKQAVSNLTAEQAERVELNPIIVSACQRVMEHHCGDVLKFGKDEGEMMECLIEHKNDLDSRSDYKCKAAVEHFQLLSLKNYHFTYNFKEACRPLVMRYCHESKTKVAVIECLSGLVQEDVLNDRQPRILKDCRQQLKMQLYQQHENIQFDPVLQKTCETDIKQLCYNIEPGNSQIYECLASQKPKLTDNCRRQLFKIRRQEFQDSSTDFMLLNSCRSMIRQFCYETDRSQALECLKSHKDEPTFDEKCKNVVIRRMIEQNTDYRFNTALQAACSRDIASHCSDVLKVVPKDKELEGKVISCLKIQFRQWKLTLKCEQQMAHILRQTALNYHLDPLLSTLCAHEIITICRADEKDPGSVEECLKTEFNADNPEMREECRVQVADLIAESRADIHVDPLLHKACVIDLKKYCSDVPQGNGQLIMCLQITLNNKKPLQPDCYKMFSTRIEMFRNAAKMIDPPKTFGDLYSTVNRSPARRYFIVVAISMIGTIFIMGLFCGRVTRRTIMLKNK